MKNIYLKTRQADDPYITFKGAVYQGTEGWQWMILKLYKNPTNSLADPYARAFCFVTSPMCRFGELGDVYISEIPGATEWLEKVSALGESSKSVAKRLGTQLSDT